MNPLIPLQRLLGEPTFSKDGEEANFRCPFCRSYKRKLGVNPSRQVWHCFRCGSGGRLEHLTTLLHVNSIPPDLGTIVPIKWPPLGITPPSEPPGYVSLSRSRGSKIYERITAYLSSRGISPERAEQVGIGYSPTYPLRFILPITYQNRIVHYLARAYDDSVQPKELSPRITDHKSQEYWPTRQWWPRRFVLYNYDSITPGGILVLTEGFFDCEAVLKSGVPSIALLGSVLTESQAGLILQKNPSAIIIAADGDSASVGFVQKALKQLYYRTPVPIKVADIPEGKDPDELSKEVLLDLIGKALFPSQWMVRATQRGWVRTDNQNWVKRTLFKEKKRGYIYRSGV